MRNGNGEDAFLIDQFSEPFYPTYEEWKLEPIGVTEDLPSLFILPMRNGNSKL